MNDPIQYYKYEFGNEMEKVSKAKSDTSNNRISIVSLVPDSRISLPFKDISDKFMKLKNKIFFLFCFYYSALIDQAIHSALRNEHPYFDNLAKYPKFCGFLGSYHNNLHPSLILLVATLYVADEEKEQATEFFEILAMYFPSDYQRFLIEEYPRLTGRLQTTAEQQRAVDLLFRELSNATALIFQPESLLPYSESKPDLRLFGTWIRMAAFNINRVGKALDSS